MVNNDMKKLIPMKDLKKQVSLSSTTIYKMVKDGIFPKPIILQNTRIAWVDQEIEAWINQKIEERDIAI